MQIRKVTSPYHQHNYRIYLTKEELLELDVFGPAWRKFSDLIEREAKKLGDAQG